MKIFITGAAGMLANDVIPELKRNNHDVYSLDINISSKGMHYLDIIKYEDVKKEVNKYLPDIIFHFAAETDVDLCEKEPKHAYRVNTLGTENIALICQEYNLPLLYISSGAIFSGEKIGMYTEFDLPKPVNVYGNSKLQGEIVIKNLLTKYFIVRAGWMVGGWEIDKKFVFKIVKQIRDGKKELNVVNDKFGSPTFTVDFAKNILPLLNMKRYGLYHMANKGTCSRFDIALKIIEYMGLENKIKVNPVASDQFPLLAPRGRSEMIENYKLGLMGLDNMPHWHESLKVYIESNAKNQQ